MRRSRNIAYLAMQQKLVKCQATRAEGLFAALSCEPSDPSSDHATLRRHPVLKKLGEGGRLPVSRLAGTRVQRVLVERGKVARSLQGKPVQL